MKKIAILALAAASTAALAQMPNSVWLFNNSLSPNVNVNGLAAAALYDGGGSPSYGSELINGVNKTYLNVGAQNQLRVTSGLVANGGSSSWVNQFTFIEEVKASGAFGIYDSNNGNPANGPEAWMDSSGHINAGWDGGAGVDGTIHTSTLTVDMSKWHQFAVSVDMTAGQQISNVYVDGVLFLSSPTDVLDGKESLYTPSNGSYTGFFTGKHVNGIGDSKIAYLYTYGSALTQQQIQNAVPEPATMVGLAAGLAVLLRRRRK